MELRTQATQNRESTRTKPHEYLRGDVEGELADLLVHEILFHLRLEQLKLDLQQIADFDLRRIFTLLDQRRVNFIDHSAMRRYLSSMGHQPLPEEVSAIMRRLDIDGDQKIDFSEFVESI